MHVVLHDIKTATTMEMEYHKHTKTNAYEVFFNNKTGLEVCRGINGNPDPFKTDLPLLLDIGIMGSCKNHCPFCYQGDDEEPDMTLENYKTIIDQVKDHTNQVALGGRGDPNKHENFEEILLYSRKNGVIPSYTTSGIDLTDEEIELSKLCGAVAVSDYGQDHTYQAVQRFINAGIKTNIHLIFSKASYHKCTKILHGYNPWVKTYLSSSNSLFEVEKLNGVVILLFKPQGRGADCPDMVPHAYQIESVADLLFKRNELFKIGIDSCLANYAYQYGKLTEEQKMGVDSCEASRMSAYISPSMMMMPCSYAEKTLAVQINKKNNISDIWNHSKPFKKFNSLLKKNEYCCPAGF
jgi:MoaA/NifB/PqqE/SkfB family radical SAM enzyme